MRTKFLGNCSVWGRNLTCNMKFAIYDTFAILKKSRAVGTSATSATLVPPPFDLHLSSRFKLNF